MELEFRHRATLRKHQSAFIGGDGDSSSTAGPKAEDLGHRADE